MLLVEYTHNHPVLRVFCQILLRKNIFSLVYYEKNKKDVELANENKPGKLVEIKLSCQIALFIEKSVTCEFLWRLLEGKATYLVTMACACLLVCLLVCVLTCGHLENVQTLHQVATISKTENEALKDISI